MKIEKLREAKARDGPGLTVGGIEKTRSERLGAEIRRNLDTKALRQANKLELLR